MMLFLVLLLGILWLCQVVFFGEIYKGVRIYEIKRSTRLLAEAVELEDYRLEDISENVAAERQVCVLIFDEFGNIIESRDSISDCIIHSLPAKTVYMMYEFAAGAGGEKLARFKLDGFRGLEYVGDGSHYADLSEDDAAESIIYTKIVRSEKYGRNVAVMLNATISPVTTTVRALQGELVIITVIMVLLAALLSLFMARWVSKPIICLNKSAKELAKGNYDVSFKAGGYREISELSDTMEYASSELAKTGMLQRELIANISHDLRTPLTMIKGYAEMMRDIPEEKNSDNLDVIIAETERLSSLVNDVLDISRLQSGVNDLNLTEFNLTEAINEVIGRFSGLNATKSRCIRFVYDCQAVVTADYTRILQVVYNFITNALDHSAEDTEVVITQKIVSIDGVNRVRIEVADEGEGIAPEDIDKIWDRYYKVDKQHRRATAGSGLGLSIVKGILELHGAEYGVESEVGKGSIFWFRL